LCLQLSNKSEINFSLLFCIFVAKTKSNRKDMTTITLEYDAGSPEAVTFIEYIRTLPFIREKRTKTEGAFERIPGVPYTVEQLRERAARADADIAAGRTIPHEEVFKPYRQWL
jgi:hypothetical protein